MGHQARMTPSESAKDPTVRRGPREVALAYLAAFSTGDPDRIVALVSDDFVNEHTGALASGSSTATEYRRRLPTFLEQFTGLTYEPEDVITDGSKVAVPYVMRCRYEGHTIELRGMFRFEVRDGTIAHRVDYWDGVSFLRQIGQDPLRR